MGGLSASALPEADWHFTLPLFWGKSAVAKRLAHPLQMKLVHQAGKRDFSVGKSVLIFNVCES